MNVSDDIAQTAPDRLEPAGLEPAAAPPAEAAAAETRPADHAVDSASRQIPEPRRWTLHGLNNGLIFRLTCIGVRRLPRAVSYALGDTGSWIAWRLMPGTRAALADNLRAIFPSESEAALQRRARRTLRAYSRDAVDFLRALRVPEAAAPALFDMQPEYFERFRKVLDLGKGAILVTGHHGNWEIGSILMRRVLHLPLAIVAMAESSADVNRIRREMRDDLGVDTIEVRRSFDTALQIRRRLAENQIVAILMDRHLGRDRVQVTLLGRPAWFLRTPALMGYLTGAPLVPCFIERSEGRPFDLFVGEPIVVSRSLPREEAIQAAAQQFADQLGARVHRHPEFWYQFYRYWDAQQDSYEGLIGA
ncbi:MAG: lysophospholipid acyltransferase family protein [Acidobacteriota bacterium]